MSSVESLKVPVAVNCWFVADRNDVGVAEVTVMDVNY